MVNESVSKSSHRGFAEYPLPHDILQILRTDCSGIFVWCVIQYRSDCFRKTCKIRDGASSFWIKNVFIFDNTFFRYLNNATVVEGYVL